MGYWRNEVEARRRKRASDVLPRTRIRSSPDLPLDAGWLLLHEAGMRERGDEEAGCELAQVESDGKEVWSTSRDAEVGGARFQVLMLRASTTRGDRSYNIIHSSSPSQIPQTLRQPT